MALTVDRAAVWAGARLAVIVGGAAIVLAQAVHAFTSADANFPLYLVLLGGLGAGGRTAGRRQPRTPLTHGALAAIGAYLVLIVAITVIRIGVGDDLANPLSLVFNGMMAASAGMFGGYLAARREGRER